MASFVQYNWVTSKAQHPNMARLFLDYLTSEEGQQVVAEQGRTPLLDVDSPVSLSEITPTGTTFLDQADLVDRASRVVGAGVVSAVRISVDPGASERTAGPTVERPSETP